MTESTMTAKGQTTVPVDIRQSLGFQPGTRLAWHVLNDGRLFVRVKNKSLLDVSNRVAVPNGKTVSVEDMKSWQ
jgi:bifunctional DNA-binding transcriptional regulator/antitoxin component of YhaV-PrlF toxin-antitoxin module